MVVQLINENVVVQYTPPTPTPTITMIRRTATTMIPKHPPIIGYLLFIWCCVMLSTKEVHSLKPSQYGNGPNLAPPTSQRGTAYQNEHLTSNQNYDNDDDNGGYVPNTSITENDNMFDHESVEERLASWRAQQQQRFEDQNPVDKMNPRDEEGRLKLLASVSRGSISVFFFVLMWRSVHHFELSDQAFQKSARRMLLVVPTVLLFIGNMAGCVASVTSRTTRAKKRMKAILNLNKLVELVLFLYNVVRLAVWSNKFVPREIYVGRAITNFMFLVQCQLFTRVTWDAAKANQGMNTSTEYDQQTMSQARGDNDGEYSRSEYENYNDNNFDDDNNDARYSQRQQSSSYIDTNDDWQR